MGKPLGNMATVFGVAEYDGITIVALITDSSEQRL